MLVSLGLVVKMRIFGLTFGSPTRVTKAGEATLSVWYGSMLALEGQKK